MASALGLGLVVGAVGLTASPGSAWAQQDLRPVVADLQVRITQLEDLVRHLTGQMEKADFQTRQLEQKFELMQRDTDLRLRELEGTGGQVSTTGRAGSGAAAANPPAKDSTGASGAPTASSSAAASSSAGSGLAPDSGILGYLPSPQAEDGLGGGFVPPTAAPGAAAGGVVLPPGTPEEQYGYAFSLLRQGDYNRAEKAFQAFIKANPSHSLAGNAQYWLGETYYARGDYENAAVAFAKGFKDYAGGSKTPDNLFKLGMSMSALGKKREACAAFQKLRSDYPGVAGTLQRQVTDQMRRNGC